MLEFDKCFNNNIVENLKGKTNRYAIKSIK